MADRLRGLQQANSSFSGGKEGDLYSVRVDNERYELPEAVVFGG